MSAQPPLEEAPPTLEQQVGLFNERLREAGSSSSEQAFAIGCGIGLLPVLLILALLFVFRLANIILVSILLVMAFLVMMGVGMLLASIARQNNIRRVYREQVEPEIGAYLARTGLPQGEFFETVTSLLPETAPLRAALVQTTGPHPPASSEAQESL